MWLPSGPIREGFREEVMSGLGLEACAGFGTAAIHVSEEAKRGGDSVAG